MTDDELEISPNAKLDYGFDWQSKGWLASGETVITSTWETGSLTASSPQNNGTVTSVLVEGAVTGNSYKITNTIVTSVGRRDSRTITLSCKNR